MSSFNPPTSSMMWQGSGFSRVPEPFYDMASQAMPTSMPTSLRWCEFLLNSQGVYRAAVNRIVSYFMTEVEVSGDDLSDDQKSDMKSFLVDQLRILDHLKWERMDSACYGNSFRSVVESFTRYFSCPHCRLEMTLDAIDQFKASTAWGWSDFRLQATCPKCKKRDSWKMHDRRAGTDDDLTIKAWSPHEILIQHDKFSGRNRYVWVIPEDYRRQVRDGDLQVIRNCPAEVIRAVKEGSNIRFADDYLFHGKSQTFAGVDSQGWGIPRVLTNFRQAWYLQLLLRFNEAIALDYLIPIRVVTPDNRAGATPESSDPILGMNLADGGRRIQDIISRHRSDPTQIHYAPYPIKYQTLGGEASQLAPFQLIDQALDTLLNCIDTPVELYKMTLSSQDAPARLRLFEAVHREIPSNANAFLAFIMKKISQYKEWTKGEAMLVPVRLVDDITKDQTKFQMSQMGLISPQTTLASVGLDAKQEFRKNIGFQQFQAEVQQEMQQDMESQGVQGQLSTPPMMAWAQQQQSAGGGQGGAAGPGPQAAPAPPGGAAAQFAVNSPQPTAVPQSPQETLERARNIAMALVSQPEAAKNQQLRQLKQTSPLLHDAVLQALEDVRDDASRQGQAMILQKQGVFRGALSVLLRDW